MKCQYCPERCIKKGFQQNGKQRFQCRSCHKYQQLDYTYKACYPETDRQIVNLLKEGCGINSISRLIEISAVTVLSRILKIASTISKPIVAIGKQYEMDELITYVGCKQRPCWIAYAMRRDTGEVADFRVGKRTNKTLRGVINTLILSDAHIIFTDRLRNYPFLIPQKLHQVKRHHTNRIERKNLTLRTHLKRLGRRTICFSKSLLMLIACLKIYFWGD